MKILLTIVALFFIIPIICVVAVMSFHVWKILIKNTIEAIRYATSNIPTIRLRHDDNTGNSLIWDPASKIMYGHPDGVKEIEE